ncbi:MAG: hypothetical protein GF331_23250 [Chitinivibrionales bacterium]|nr:hypothetical protein [Chitinivibrionales bacterium]
MKLPAHVGPKNISITGLLIVTLLCLRGTAVAGAASIRVDLNERLQVIDGFGAFGGASFSFDDYGGGPFFDEDFLDLVIDDLGATIIRTDLMWDFEEPQGTFNIGPNSLNGQLGPFYQALAARGVKLIATVWSPPGWMKDGILDGASWCDGQCGGELKPQMRDEYANYLAQFVKSLKSEFGVDLYALSMANEPRFNQAMFQSCVFDPDQYALAFKEVGARFAADQLPTLLFGPEDMFWRIYEWGPEFCYVNELLGDADAKRHLDIYALHGYTDGIQPGGFDPPRMDAYANKIVVEHGTPLWLTETSYLQGTGDSYDDMFEMTKGLHIALRHGRISAWVYWYWGNADQVLSNSIIMGRLGNTQPAVGFYLFKPYYRYVRPGYQQVGSSSSNPDVLVTAYERDGNLTVVALNEGHTEHTMDLTVSGANTPSSVKVVQTARDRYAVHIGDGVAPAGISLPARSVTAIYTGSPETEAPDFHGWGNSPVSKPLVPREAGPDISVIGNRISLPMSTDYQITLVELNGRSTSTRRGFGKTAELLTPDMASGVYIARIEVPGIQSLSTSLAAGCGR